MDYERPGLNVEVDHILPEGILPGEDVRLCFRQSRIDENACNDVIESFVEGVETSGCSAAETHLKKN
jgi:hypothetical protein